MSPVSGGNRLFLLLCFPLLKTARLYSKTRFHLEKLMFKFSTVSMLPKRVLLLVQVAVGP